MVSHASMPIMLPWLGDRYAQHDRELIERAVLFVQTAFPDLKSEYDPSISYLDYAADLARLLAEFPTFQVDGVTIAAAIIAYPADIASLAFAEIEERVGYDVASLCQQVHALRALEWHIWDTRASPLRAEFEQRQWAFKQDVLKKAYLQALEEPRHRGGERSSPIDTGVQPGEHRAARPDDRPRGPSPNDTGFQKRETRREYLVRLLLTAAPDIRGLLIVLADRLCVCTLLERTRRNQADVAMFAQVTLDIYAPLADRLGIWSLKSRLETEAFRLLEHERYNEIARLLTRSASVAERRLGDIAASIQALLDEFGITATVTAREKHAYSIFRKMQAKHLNIDQINDLLGVRVIIGWSEARQTLERQQDELLARRTALFHDRQVLFDRRTALLSDHNTKQVEIVEERLKGNQREIRENRTAILPVQEAIVADEKAAKDLCFDVLSILTARWPPQTELYGGNAARDWISKPKPNQYQSLHTTLRIDDHEDLAVEVQIRTQAMHNIAEDGAAAAHWRYKATKAYARGKVSSEVSSKDAAWTEQLTEIRRTLAEERAAFTFQQPRYLKDRIFVITPMGDIVDLRAGASPIDFAYRIHTERGHAFAGAKVNGRIVRNDYELRNGDIVDLLPGRGKGPSINWLATTKDEAGTSRPMYVRTPQARYKIRHWLRQHGMLSDNAKTHATTTV